MFCDNIFSLITEFLPDGQWLNVALSFKAMLRALEKRNYKQVTYVGTDLLPWAVSQGYKMTYATSNMLTCAGDVAVFEWARENGCPWTYACCEIAVRSDDLKMLQWLLENGCPWSENTYVCAARQGNLEVIKWLRSKYYPWPQETGRMAAEYGQLKVLKWLYENDFVLDASLCSRAALGGQLEVLKWLRSVECPWDSWTCVGAQNHRDVTEWIHQNNCPCRKLHWLSANFLPTQMLPFQQNIRIDVPYRPLVSANFLPTQMLPFQQNIRIDVTIPERQEESLHGQTLTERLLRQILDES